MRKAITTFGLLLLSACASGPLHLTSSSDVPAAKGVVETEETDNKNTRVKIDVSHLAAATKVDPAATTYVVWVKAPNSGTASNVGALGLNENLHGSITTTTPLRDFELFITAEGSGLAEFPQGKRVLWANVGSG